MVDLYHENYHRRWRTSRDPKSIREQLGLAPGTEVDVAEREGHIEIAAAETPMQLVVVDGVLVARSADELPLLTDDTVRETLEQTRR